MASQIERIVAELRSRILSGSYAAQSRLVELSLSAELGVSRTPLRIALVELEREGLVERLATRGFRVRGFTLDDVGDAIDVRGTLEGMAARRAAERGVDAKSLQALKACLADGQRLIDAFGAKLRAFDASGWTAMNVHFHRLLVDLSGNAALASALDHIGKTPMAAAGALTLGVKLPTLELAFLKRAQEDHEQLVAALEAREGARAEALMRDHARRSRDNKRLLIGQLLKMNGRVGEGDSVPASKAKRVRR